MRAAPAAGELLALTGGPRRRLRAVRADMIVPGDRLWSSSTERALLVLAAARVRVPADGNLYAEVRELELEDPEQDRPMVDAIVISVMTPDGETTRLGAFAPRARLQVIGYR